MTAEPIDLKQPAATPVHEDGTACTCGESSPSTLVLDTRQIPHAIRHATIFGALDALAVGISLDIVASHMPAPLLAQLEQRNPGAFLSTVIDNGPEAWKIRLTRVGQ
ncbi:MAG: DUF2249 domain-containing protein [Microbacteriaceae bacterium]